MLIYRQYLLILPLFLFVGDFLLAQAEYHLRLQPDGITYTAYVRSQSDWLPPLDNIVHQAKVTVVAPANGLQIIDLESHLGDWTMTHQIKQPAENIGADYFLFELIGSVSDSIFLQDVEMPLFSFKNNRPCAGTIELMDMGIDPFAMPNSMSMPVGQHFIVGGATGSETYIGNYGVGQADCMDFFDCHMEYQIALLPSGIYEINLITENNPTASIAVQSLKIALKVPSNFFKLHDLTNLQSNGFAFSGVMRFDAPIEEPDYDYIVINMSGIGGQAVPIVTGNQLPLLSFGNGGSCQGDSIFLVKNSGDPFLQPNSQNAIVNQQVILENDVFPQPVCVSNQNGVPCKGCLFTAGVIEVGGVISTGPILCLGQTDGSVQIFAEGVDSLSYSIDGGQIWQASPVFDGLGIGDYQPLVRGDYYGCSVAKALLPIELEEETTIPLELGITDKICEGGDLPLRILSPLNMPSGTSYAWSGPLGFTADNADPVLFDANVFQTGDYSLTVNVPGCDEATAIASLKVLESPEMPTLSSNAPICDGNPLVLTTDVEGAKYEWVGPAGQSANTLSLIGLTTDSDSTILTKDHPAYLTGEWAVRVIDDNGCMTESPVQSIEIKERPQAYAGNNGPVCLGKDAVLSATQLQGAVYRWRKQGEPNAFSFDAAPVLNNITSENTYELEVELDGCVSENTAITTVALHPKPSAFPVYDYQIATDCAPEDIELTANGSGMSLTYEWAGANGFSSQIENPVIPNASTQSNGSYQLKVTNLYGCEAVSPFDITGIVDAVQAPDVLSTGAVCPGGDIVLSVAPYSGSNVSYKWFKDNIQIFGATSSQLNLDAVQSDDDGMYNVEVQVDACEVESADLLVEVLQKPSVQPDFVLSFPCEGSTLQLLSNTNSANVTTWQWAGPNGFSSNAQTPVIYNTEFDDVGSYSLTITANNGCTATGSFIVDGILPIPDAPTVATNSPVCPEDEMILVVQNPTLLGTVNYEWFNGLGEYIDNGTEKLELSTSDPLAVPPFLVKKKVNGCESEFSDPIPIIVKPMPVANAVNSGAVCPGGNVELIAAPLTNATYTWRRAGEPQVFSFEQNPLVTIDDTTVFELTVQTIGCDTMAVDTTTVFTKTEPVVTNLMGGGSHCEGAVVQLSGENGAPISGDVKYTWTGPNGFIFTNTVDAAAAFSVDIGVLEAQNEGAYTLQLESGDGCLSLPQSVVVDVVEMPAPPVLTVSSAQLCEGEQLQLEATGYPGSNVNYDWYVNDGNVDQLLGSTDAPTFFIDNIMPTASGFYFVKTNVDGCEPPSSNLEQVTVFGIDVNVEAISSSPSDQPVCEGEEVQLEATLVAGATYNWYGPAGFQASGNVPVLNNVDLNMAGNYIVEISLPGCSNPLSTSTTVFIKPQPNEPILNGPLEVCAATDVTIEIANAVPNAVYHFYFTENNMLIETGSTPSFLLPQILVGQSGNYYATMEVDGCSSDASDWFNLNVISQEVVEAFAGEPQVICDVNESVFLSGNMPASSTGIWLPINGATINQPDASVTSVHDLRPGANYFTWKIDQPVCQYSSVDTTLVFYEKIAASADVYTLALDDTIAVVDVVANDAINSLGWDVALFDAPKKGTADVDADGQATYRPYTNVFGEDQFTYQICSMNCPSVCSRTKVDLLLENTDLNPSDCFVPNLISPNNDGENDVFVIPCAAVFEGSELVVFNRYGTSVYQSPNYQNDWEGTYSGQPLPVGTYFYQLSLNDEQRTMLQGYVTILR